MSCIIYSYSIYCFLQILRFDIFFLFGYFKHILNIFLMYNIGQIIYIVLDSSS